jgi:adenine deaminase
MTLPVIDKKIRADINQDILKVAAVDRTRNPGKMFVGLIKGFCMKSGAIACSAAWDTSDIIVVGVDNRDMAYAVNRIHALQGGAVVCDKQKILAELSLPVFGVTSDIPMDVLAQRLKNIKKAVSDLGVPFANPLLTLITLTGAAIPYLRICEEGLVNLKDGKTLNLIC